MQLAFSPSQIPSKSLKFKKGNYHVEELLTSLLQFGIHYTYQNDIILITYRNPEITLSGYVRDIKNGESLIGASIKLDNYITNTNEYGFFSINIPRSEYLLKISFIGFETKKDTLELFSSSRKNYYLTQRIENLDEVIIESSGLDYHINSVVPGEIDLDYTNKGEIPYFLGEVDVLQETLLMPGIQTLGEDASGLNIRGGAIDQNLISIDEATIYNPNHFFGLISVFNPESFNKVKIMKGFIPPKYGGRASSVITVYQKEGNNQSYHLSGGIGIVSARLTAEGPIKKDKSSFLFSARKSIFDLSRITNLSNSNNSKTGFNDLNAKFNWIINNKNTLFISGYRGNDSNKTNFDAIRKWGNTTLTVRWNNTINSKWFSHLSSVMSKYSYKINDPIEAGSYFGRSSVFDYTLKYNVEHYYSVKSLFDFGVSGTLHRLRPGERLPFDGQSSSSNPFILDPEKGIEFASYLSHEYSVNNNLSIMYGIRYSSITILGHRDLYIYESGLTKSAKTITDTISYSNNETVYTTDKIDPRVSITLRFNESNSLKISYTQAIQYIHLLSNEATPSPTDIWKLSDKYVPPVISKHYSIGYYKLFKPVDISLSIEAYYKNLYNLIDYKDGANLVLSAIPETELLVGKGKAYGLEFMLQKEDGIFKGWISYLYSKSVRQFKGLYPDEIINNGKYFPENHDKPHNLSIVSITKLKPRLSFSATFNYSTGRPITFPSGKYQFNNTVVPYFDERNQDRLSNYHRMDLALKMQGKRYKKNGEIRKYLDYYTFTIYNVYARKNAYTYFFRQSASNPELAEIVRYSIFGTIIPSFTYNFRF